MQATGSKGMLITTSNTRVGFVGAGIMGGPMIANLVKAGFEVRALGRSAASRARIAAAGAIEVTSLREVADRAGVVITMLPDSPDVRAVVLGEDGLLEHLVAGQVFIDMSSIKASVAIEIAEALAAKGVGSLDAPVSGGDAAAIEGTLSLMVGGTEAALASALPALQALGSVVTRVGGPGAGQTTKSANQLIVGSNIQAVAEAIVLLEASGVDLANALTAINGGLAGSTVLMRKREKFLSGDYVPGARVDLHDKDMTNVLAIALEHGLSLPVTSLVAQLMAALKEQGDGGLDHSALLKLARESNRAN